MNSAKVQKCYLLHDIVYLNTGMYYIFYYVSKNEKYFLKTI